MAKVFVSYSRKDITFAKRLTAELQKCELDFWIDWEGIPPTVDWWKEIEKGIEEADIFVFLISPDSARSKICGQEIETAVRNGKRIIPIVVRDIAWQDTPKNLGHLNYIFFREEDDFDAAVKKLITAIQTDYEWAATHRRLQVKALDWERNKKESGFFLRGLDLLDAEQDLAMNTSKEPHPTDLQREYVFESRKATDKQRKTTTGIAIGGTIVLAVLTVVAIVMAVRATRQARISRAGELAAQSVEVRQRDFQLSLLLAIEAFRAADTMQSRGALLGVTNDSTIIQFITLPLSEGKILAFDKEGNNFVSVANHSINVWEAKTRTPQNKPLTAHKADVDVAAFSPDGKTLASAACAKLESSSICSESEIILWNLRTFRMIGQPLRGQQGRIIKLIFSPDGKTLASLSSPTPTYPMTILWDISSQMRLGQPIQHEANMQSAAFSRDGRVLALGASDKSATLWDVQTQKLIQEIPSNGGGGQMGIEFGPDNKTIVLSSWWLGGATIWDLEAKEDKYFKAGETDLDFVTTIALSPNGKILAASRVMPGVGAGDDLCEIVLWSMDTLEPIGQRLNGHKGKINSMAFSHDGKMLISISEDNVGILWDIPSALGIRDQTIQPIGSFLPPPASQSDTRTYSFERQLLFNPDPESEMLASADGTGSITFWDINSYKQREHKVQVPVYNFNFTQDGKRFIAVNGEVITLWDISKQEHTDFKARIDAPRIVVSSDGSTLISYNAFPPEVQIWQIPQTPNSTSSTQITEGVPLPVDSSLEITSIAISPDGKRLVIGTADAKLELWDLVQRKLITSLSSTHTDAIFHLTFSRAGKILASGDGATIILWDLEKREAVGQSFRGSEPALSPNGNILAVVVSSDSATVFDNILLWDIKTHQPIGHTLIHPMHLSASEVTSLAFSPDNNTLASISNDGTTVLWDLKPETWIRISCQRAGRNLTIDEWEQYGFTEPYRKTCDQWP